jgi:hypothetical protein
VNLSSEEETSDKVARIMAVIDRAGAAPLPIAAWVEMLTEIQSECEVRIVAAREDLRRGK